MVNRYFKTGFFAQFTDEQMKAQYKKNARQLADMAKVAQGKKKYRGFTPQQLERYAKEYSIK